MLPAAEWEAFVRSWGKNLLSIVDGAIYVCMSSKEWPLVSRALTEEGDHWSDTGLALKRTSREVRGTRSSSVAVNGRPSFY